MSIRPSKPVHPVPEKPRKSATFYPARSGAAVRSGQRQSMPSSSMESWADVRLTLPVFVNGQSNLPRSMRLENRHIPWPSNQSSLIRSPRLPRKANSAPECGDFSRTCWTNTASPSKPFLGRPGKPALRVAAGSSSEHGNHPGKGLGIDHRVHGQTDTRRHFDADLPATGWRRRRNVADDRICDLNLRERRQSL